MFLIRFISFFSFLFSHFFFSCTGNLNEYISHYETLNYDHHQIHASHSRAKRSVTKDPYVYLKFRAHNRPFHLRLKRDVDTFSDNLVVSCTCRYRYKNCYYRKYQKTKTPKQNSKNKILKLLRRVAWS